MLETGVFLQPYPIILLKNQNTAKIYSTFMLYNINSMYICTVFFMVLDLRLMRDWLS